MSSVGQQMLLAGEAAATLTFQGTTNYPSDGQTVTFLSVDIGAAASGRYVFVSIPYYNGTLANYSIGSVTIGGVLATIHSQPFVPVGATAYGGCALVSALVPIGATADIIITWAASGAGYYRPEINVYRVTGLRSNTPTDLVTNTASNHSPSITTVTVQKGGIALLACHMFGDSNSRTMSGLPTDFMTSPLASTVYIGGGSAVSTAGPLTATIPNSGQAYWCVIMASFR
ncbi:MAG: hypothetical protein EKK41_12485 [Hyphomicrobiales bacterium]|nr:MAG: hypothetical protein EKK41_12485 [Hyphomicrobiales bacterium]